MLDLSTIDPTAAADKPTPMVFHNPMTGEPVLTDVPDPTDPTKTVQQPLRFFYKGLESRDGRAKKREIQNRRLKKLNRGKKADYTAERAEADKIEMLAAICTGWDPFLWRGEPLQFNAANAKMIHEAMPALVEQAEDHVGDLENYAGNA